MPAVDVKMFNGLSRSFVAYVGMPAVDMESEMSRNVVRHVNRFLTGKLCMFGHGFAWRMLIVNVEMMNGLLRLCVAYV